MFAQNICSLKFHLSCHHPNINHRKGTPNGFHKRNWFESWMKCEEFAIGFVCIPMHPWNRKWYYDWWFVVHILLFHVQWHSTWSSIWYHNSKSCELLGVYLSLKYPHFKWFQMIIWNDISVLVQGKNRPLENDRISTALVICWARK